MRNCPERQVAAGGGAPGGANAKMCYSCGNKGHLARDCQVSRTGSISNDEDRDLNGQGLGRRGIQRCFNCHQFGHNARECSAMYKGPTCYRFDVK